eukprot:gene18614-biopygen9963
MESLAGAPPGGLGEGEKGGGGRPNLCQNHDFDHQELEMTWEVQAGLVTYGSIPRWGTSQSVPGTPFPRTLPKSRFWLPAVGNNREADAGFVTYGPIPRRGTPQSVPETRFLREPHRGRPADYLMEQQGGLATWT